MGQWAKKGPKKWGKKTYGTAKKTTDNWLMQQNVHLEAKVVFAALSVLHHRPKTKSFKTLLKIACLRMLLSWGREFLLHLCY